MVETMTWERAKYGGKPIEGRFFRSAVDAKGVHDGDTLYGVTIELPDNDFDGEVDTHINVDGKRVPLPEVWRKGSKFATFDPQKGAVYMKNAAVRFAGYDAWEMRFTPEGEAAKQALLTMFRGGWVDSKVKDRFRFVVRGVGTLKSSETLPAHEQEPHLDKYQRIITDIYIVENGKQKRVGEMVLKNPVDDLIQGKHGVGGPYRNRPRPQNVYPRGANVR